VIAPGRHCGGGVAVAELSASIEALEGRGAESSRVEDMEALGCLLFLRGDLLGLIADHERAAEITGEAARLSPDPARALYLRARVAGRFHLFGEASTLLDGALAAGFRRLDVDRERASLLRSSGRYAEALRIRGSRARWAARHCH
jgi:hypothetical protein